MKRCETCGVRHGRRTGYQVRTGARGKGLCPACGEPLDSSGGWCRACRAAYARGHRTPHGKMTAEQRRRANARAYANVYQRRGLILPQPCEACGAPEAEKHHTDYSRPLEIAWLCRGCHRAHHVAGVSSVG